MALEKFPVEIPLGGAVNEGDVPVVVQPPRILEAHNCHSIKGGAYQKRDDDVAISAPPGEEPFAIGTTDESPITFARLQAQSWSGDEWEEKTACATVAGEAQSFYPTDGGELNLSPDIAATPAQATADEERVCVAWYTRDPTLPNETAYRIYGGDRRRPIIPERRIPQTGAVPTLRQGGVFVRSVESVPGLWDFVIVTSGGATGASAGANLYRVNVDGVVTFASNPTTSTVVDVQAADNYVSLLVHDAVVTAVPPQTTAYEILRVQITTGIVTPILASTYPARTSAPCGLYLLGTGATVIFSDGTTTTVPIGGGATSSSTILDLCVESIGTAAPVPATLPQGSYLPPGQIRPQSFLSHDIGADQAWVGINTQAFQQTPMWRADTPYAAPANRQRPNRPLGEMPEAVPAEAQAGYNFPNWANGLYGCAYVEHVLCDVAADGSLTPVSASQGVLQGAAVAGGGYYSESTGHTAMLSTPSPANIFTDSNVRPVPAPPPAPATDRVASSTFTPRADWVQPTVMWCARSVVPGYDALTEILAPAPPELRARNQALSIGAYLPGSGTLSHVNGDTSPLGLVHGLQNQALTGPRCSIVAVESGALMMTLEFESAQAPDVPQPAPIDGAVAGTDILRPLSSDLNGELSSSRPRVFEFRTQTSIDLCSEGVSVATAGSQPITIGRANPLAAGNPLQAPIITYGCPTQDAPSAVLSNPRSSSGGVPLVNGALEPLELADIIFEGADWTTGPTTGSLFVCQVTLRTMLSAIDTDDEEHRSTPWLPNPEAPPSWFGQVLFNFDGGTVSNPQPGYAAPQSVCVLISPVTWQLMGVPSTARYALELYACGPLGQPARTAVAPIPLIVPWQSPQAAVWTLGQVIQTTGTTQSLAYVGGDGALLYTEAGELAADAPPPLRSITAANGRLFGIASTRLREVYYTKQSRRGYAPEWNRNLSIRVNDSPDDLTALGALPDGRLLIFTENATYYTYGQGPSDTGQGAGFAEPALLSRDVGCIDWRTVAEGSFGVMFRGERGIYLVDRQLSMQFVGLPYEDTTTRDIEITSTAVDAFRSEVNFFVTDPASEQQAWTYNYLRGQWSSYTAPTSIRSATEQGSNVALLTETAPAFYGTRERTPSGAESLMRLRTGWLAMGRIQGFGRVWELQIEGRQELTSGSGLQIELRYDYEEGVSETFDYDTPSDAQGRIKIRLRPGRQKCEAISVTFKETVPGVVSALGWELEMLTLLCGVKVGLDKVATTEAS